MSKNESQNFPQRRRHPRVSFEIEIACVQDGEFAYNSTGNISLGGVLVYAQKPLPLSTRVDLSFVLPRLKKPILAEGEVRWSSRQAGGALFGMGIMFLKLQPVDARLLREALEIPEEGRDSGVK